MIKFIFLIISCLFLPDKADALTFGEFGRETITLAKAVKLGRGNSYSSEALAKTGSGQTNKVSCAPSSCSAGRKFDMQSCSCTACPGGEDCGCAVSFGERYAADGKGGCESSAACPNGQYLDYFGGGCKPCPANAVCDGDTFTCNNGYYLSSGSFCQKCDEITYFKGCSACTGKQCLACKSGYKFDAGSGYCVVSSPCPANCSSCTASAYCVNCAGGYKLTADRKCEKVTCSPGQYVNGTACSSCPGGEDCGCKAAYGGMSVSNGSGACGCPSGFTFEVLPGNKRDYTACKSVPCAEGEDCGCVSRYGAASAADGKGGCKSDISCPAGQYLDYFGGGCKACPADAVCSGSVTWRQHFSSQGLGCAAGEDICNGPVFVCNKGYYLSSGSFCAQCPVGCATCTGNACLTCKTGYEKYNTTCKTAACDGTNSTPNWCKDGYTRISGRGCCRNGASSSEMCLQCAIR